MKSLKINAICYDEEYDLFCVASSDSLLSIKSTENMKGCKDYLTLSTEPHVITSLLIGKA